MSPEKQDKAASGITSPKLKTALITLLILSAVAGYAGIFFFPTASVSAFSEMDIEKDNNSIFKEMDLKKITEIDLHKITSVLEKTIEQSDPEISISFNGVLLGETGTVAIVNGKMVVPGAEIEKDIRVVEITNRTMTLQYKDQTQNLTIGETVILHR